MATLPAARQTMLRSGREWEPTKQTEVNTNEDGTLTGQSGERNKDEAMTDKYKDRGSAPCPNHADDPDPPSAGSSRSDRIAHAKELKEYSEAMFGAYSSTSLRGEILWSDFITAFRPHTIMSWSRATQVEWRALLAQRGILIDRSRTGPVAAPIINILYRPDHIGTVSQKGVNVVGYSADHVEVVDNDQYTQHGGTMESSKLELRTTLSQRSHQPAADPSPERPSLSIN